MGLGPFSFFFPSRWTRCISTLLASIKPTSVSINKRRTCSVFSFSPPSSNSLMFSNLMFSLREYASRYKFFVSKPLIYALSSLFSSSMVAILRLIFSCFLSTFARLVLYLSFVKLRLSCESLMSLITLCWNPSRVLVLVSKSSSIPCSL